MIAPEFRSCDNVSLLAPTQTFISFNYGKHSSLLAASLTRRASFL